LSASQCDALQGKKPDFIARCTLFVNIVESFANALITCTPEKYRMRTRPSLLRLIVGYFVFTLVAIIMPGLWFIQSSFEERLVEEKLYALQEITANWTSRFNDCSLRAEASISRFSQTLSNLPSHSVSESALLFDHLVKKDDDGSWRSDRSHFSPGTEAGIWLPPEHPLTDAKKSQYLGFKKATELFGEGSIISNFVDTWVLPKEGGVIIYWPSEPDFISKTAPELDYSATERITLTEPETNPDGLPRWTKASYDPTPGVWMVSVVAPYTRNGQWAGAVGHDLPLASLKWRMDETHIYPGTYHLIVRRDGLVLISDKYGENINRAKGNLRIEDIEDLALLQFLGEITADSNQPSPPSTVTISNNGMILLANHIESQDWFFISVVPRNSLIQTVRASYHAILIFVGIALFLISLVPTVFIFRVILPRINRLVAGIREVSTGNLEYRFKEERSQEFHFIAAALNTMTSGINLSMEEIKKAEEALRESEERYRSIFESSIDAIFIFDMEGIIREVNPAACVMHGYSAAELIGTPGKKLVAPESHHHFDEFIQQVQFNQHVSAQAVDLRKDGSRITIEGRGTLINLKGKPHLMGVVQDISKRKQAEKDLAFKNLILSTQQETSLDGILVVDKKGRIFSFNRRFIDIWGIPQRVIDSDDNELVQLAMLKKIREPEQFMERVRYLYAHHDENSRDEIALNDGRIFDRYSSPMTGPDGNYFGRVWYFRDISDRILAALEKEKIESQLRQAEKMEAIGTLASGIAHDFNNILSAIYGYAELAYYDIAKPDLLRGNLDEIINGAERAKKLVRQILTFSRTSEQEIQPLRISLMVKEALKFLRSSIPTTIDIQQDVTSKTLVLADPTQIHQVIMNLCINAYHAMRESGGTLGVTLKDIDTEVDRITEPELAPGQYLQLEISDTGTGMDEEIQTKIFEPYFTTKGLGEGTGLGLAVVHGVVESHGGIIKVRSKPGQGTTFQVYFPVYEEENVHLFPEEQNVALGGGNEVIIFVDDDIGIVGIAMNALSRYGYEVVSFSDGVQAYRELEQHPDKYDLIITDMTMPFMTGAELSRKALEICPSLPIILCSGYSDLIEREKALTMGIREYCEKPLNLKQLLLTIRKVLDRGKGSL
jgi:PAS domain S-box-containing protein